MTVLDERPTIATQSEHVAVSVHLPEDTHVTVHVYGTFATVRIGPHLTLFTPAWTGGTVGQLNRTALSFLGDLCTMLEHAINAALVDLEDQR